MSELPRILRESIPEVIGGICTAGILAFLGLFSSSLSRQSISAAIALAILTFLGLGYRSFSRQNRWKAIAQETPSKPKSKGGSRPFLTQSVQPFDVEIPSQAWSARRKFRRYAHSYLFFRALPLSLTLGGVLFLVMGNSIIAVIAAVLIVPKIQWVASSSDERTALVHRWAHRPDRSFPHNLSCPEDYEVLFFLIYSIRKTFKGISALIEKIGKAREDTTIYAPENELRQSLAHVRASLAYIDLLADTVKDIFKFPDSDHLMQDHFGIKKNRLIDRLTQLIDLLSTARSDGGDEAKEKSEGVENELSKQFQYVQDVTDPDIAWAAIEVAAKPGTNTMIGTLENALAKIQKNNGKATALRLLEVAEATRTNSPLLRHLADLQGWYSDKSSEVSRQASKRRKATAKVANRFSQIFTEVMTRQGQGQVQRTPVAVIGYSVAVRDCLFAVQRRIGPVFIVQCSRMTQKADDLMLDALEKANLGAEIIDVTTAARERLRDVKAVLFGFEAANLRGELTHRQGLENVLYPIQTFFEEALRTKKNQEISLFSLQFLNAVNTGALLRTMESSSALEGFLRNPPTPDNELELFAVGESWKVRNFLSSLHEVDGSQNSQEEVILVPPKLFYSVGGKFRLVTDCGDSRHSQSFEGGSFNLECCRDHWSERLKSDAR